MNPPKFFSLAGKTALLTGAGQGIGLALARALGHAGARLLLNDTSAERLAAAAEGLRNEGLSVEISAFDVARESEVRPAIAQLLRDAGAIHILVNNAGIHRRGPLLEISLENWQQVLEVNLTGAFLVAQAVAPQMISRRSGKIINVCSLNAEIVRPNIGNYAAAKGGLKMLTRAMAVEWGPHNIQANGLGPGYMLTDMTRTLSQDSDFDRWIKARTPAGRWGTSEDLAGPMVFLAAGASDFMNGQILYIDGGMLAAL